MEEQRDLKKELEIYRTILEKTKYEINSINFKLMAKNYKIIRYKTISKKVVKGILVCSNVSATLFFLNNNISASANFLRISLFTFLLAKSLSNLADSHVDYNNSIIEISCNYRELGARVSSDISDMLREPYDLDSGEDYEMFEKMANYSRDFSLMVEKEYTNKRNVLSLFKKKSKVKSQ